MARRYSSALPIAHAALRTLIALNWLLGLGIALLLFVLPHEHWIMTELKLTPSADTSRFVWGLRAVAALGIIATPLHYAVLKLLLQIVESVRAGDAFIADNAYRLHAIAWVLLGLQLMSIVIGAIGSAISSPAHPIELDAGFSPAGWLAVLLTFILARIFAEGTRMRLDLDGTI